MQEKEKREGEVDRERMRVSKKASEQERKTEKRTREKVRGLGVLERFRSTRE